MKSLFTSISFLVLFSNLFSQNFTQIEAAEYDPGQNRWFVSNSSSIIIQNAAGELSFFGEGTASHGMEVMNGVLYTISGDLVKGYDLLTSEEVFSMDIPGSGFLNGMGSDPSTSRLWISDFSNSRIFELDVTDPMNPSLDPIISNTLSTPNGVVFDEFNNRVVFVNWGANAPIKQIDLDDNSMTTLINTGLTNCDGIDIDENGNFYVSSWNPTRITKYSSDFTANEIVTAPGLSNPADISFGVEIHTLGIANSGNETLTLVEFEASSVSEFGDEQQLMSLFPNPVSTTSRVVFELIESMSMDLLIYDVRGRIIQTLLSGFQAAGKHHVLLNGVEMERGHYFLSFESETLHSVRPFVVID